MSQALRAAPPPLWQWRRHFLSPQSPFHHHRFSLRRHAQFHSRGLRLPHRLDPPPETGPDETTKKSRNELKREARQTVGWGMDLTSFPPHQIKLILNAVSLEQEVYEALMLVKKLGPDVREGKRRQFNYIGKLLRNAQPDLLGSLIQAAKEGDLSRFQSLTSSIESIDDETEEEFYESESEQEIEDSREHIALANKWYDGLINNDIQISNEVYSGDAVEFDRQELRRLVRKVHYVQYHLNGNEDGTTAELNAAKKSLNLFLCALAKRLLVSSALNVIM